MHPSSSTILPSRSFPKASGRERLEHYGAGALSSAELLAINLRVGTKDENVIRLAQRLLTTYGGWPG